MARLILPRTGTYPMLQLGDGQEDSRRKPWALISGQIKKAYLPSSKTKTRNHPS